MIVTAPRKVAPNARGEKSALDRFPPRKMCEDACIGYKEVYTFPRPRTRKETSYRPSKLVTRFPRRTGKVLDPTRSERAGKERFDMGGKPRPTR